MLLVDAHGRRIALQVMKFVVNKPATVLASATTSTFTCDAPPPRLGGGPYDRVTQEPITRVLFVVVFKVWVRKNDRLPDGRVRDDRAIPRAL